MNWNGAGQRDALDTFGRLPDLVPRVAGEGIDDEQIRLGRTLWYDYRLSVGDKVSCNSCHPLDQYGADNLRLSESAEGEANARNTPTIYHTALNSKQKWDATVDTLEEQCAIAQGLLLRCFNLCAQQRAGDCNPDRSVGGDDGAHAAALLDGAPDSVSSTPALSLAPGAPTLSTAKR